MLSKNNGGISLFDDMLISYDRYNIELKKIPLPMKRETLILIEVKSCGAFLRMLVLCIFSNLKSVPRYKFLISDTCHPDALCVCVCVCVYIYIRIYIYIYIL